LRCFVSSIIEPSPGQEAFGYPAKRNVEAG
jgi:hypothetical protein